MEHEIEVRDVLINLVQVLEKCSFQDWAEEVGKWLVLWENAGSLPKKKELSRKILSAFGGSGSFNDLVFYKKGDFMLEDNETLDRLRQKLFEKLTNVIAL